MSHYGIAGFGTAAAFAKALGFKDDNKKLQDATKDIYGSDEYLTKLAETSVNIQAEDAQSRSIRSGSPERMDLRGDTRLLPVDGLPDGGPSIHRIMTAPGQCFSRHYNSGSAPRITVA